MDITTFVAYFDDVLEFKSIPFGSVAKCLVPHLPDCEAATNVFAFAALGRYAKDIAVFETQQLPRVTFDVSGAEKLTSEIEALPSFDVGVAIVSRLREKLEKMPKP